MSFTVIIPARLASSRLPEKVILDLAGKPIIQWVYEKALASGANQVWIAADDDKVKLIAEGFGAQVIMTSPDHNSGTERLAEVVQSLNLPDDEIVVNVQGDEPLLPTENIDQLAQNLARSGAPMATLSVAISDVDEVFNPNAVKVVTDKQGFALYFSRAPIPYERDNFQTSPVTQVGGHFQRHIGIYAYRADFIRRYVSWPASDLEQIESLEQLRVLWHGEKIHVAEAKVVPPAGVDTQDDLDALRALMTKGQ